MAHVPGSIPMYDPATVGPHVAAMSAAELNEVVFNAKRWGFSDKHIASCFGFPADAVREFRKTHGELHGLIACSRVSVVRRAVGR